MADFVSEFWSWFIISGTVGGIIFCWVLVFFWSGPTTEEGQEVKPTGHVWDEDLEEFNNPLPGWWLGMFHITLVFGVIYLALYPGLGTFKGFLNWTSVQEYQDEVAAADEKYGPLFEKHLARDLKEVAADPDALAMGKRLYATYCTACHGSDAGGARGFPNLRDDDWLYGGEPEKIKETIMMGRQGIMPAWGKDIDEGGIGNEAVFNATAYVRSLTGVEGDASTIAKGKEVFTANCIACHGPEGKGMQMLGAPNLTDDTWLYGGSQKRIMKTISEGRSGKMPAHGEFLGEAKVHLIAAYIYSLSQK